MRDYIVRATGAQAQIRAFACTTRNLVEAARQAHDTSPVKAVERRCHAGMHDEGGGGSADPSDQGGRAA